jgi:hypothetical protein
LGNFLEIAEVAHIFGQTFSTVKVMQINFDKNVLGKVLGDILYKLIWSLCLAVSFLPARKILKLMDLDIESRQGTHRMVGSFKKILN